MIDERPRVAPREQPGRSALWNNFEGQALSSESRRYRAAIGGAVIMVKDNGSSPANTSKLRDQIDSGHTADKVANPDPAAAPMQTGAEAAGTPTPRPEAEQDLDRQRKIAETVDPAVETSAARPQPGATRWKPAIALAVVLLVVVIGAILISVLTLPG